MGFVFDSGAATKVGHCPVFFLSHTSTPRHHFDVFLEYCLGPKHPLDFVRCPELGLSLSLIVVRLLLFAWTSVVATETDTGTTRFCASRKGGNSDAWNAASQEAEKCPYNEGNALGKLSLPRHGVEQKSFLGIHTLPRRTCGRHCASKLCVRDSYHVQLPPYSLGRISGKETFLKLFKKKHDLLHGILAGIVMRGSVLSRSSGTPLPSACAPHAGLLLCGLSRRCWSSFADRVLGFCVVQLL